jgi:hypothetical protein
MTQQADRKILASKALGTVTQDVDFNTKER